MDREYYSDAPIPQSEFENLKRQLDISEERVHSVIGQGKENLLSEGKKLDRARQNIFENEKEMKTERDRFERMVKDANDSRDEERFSRQRCDDELKRLSERQTMLMHTHVAVSNQQRDSDRRLLEAQGTILLQGETTRDQQARIDSQNQVIADQLAKIQTIKELFLETQQHVADLTARLAQAEKKPRSVTDTITGLFWSHSDFAPEPVKEFFGEVAAGAANLAPKGIRDVIARTVALTQTLQKAADKAEKAKQQTTEQKEQKIDAPIIIGQKARTIPRQRIYDPDRLFDELLR